MRTPERKRTLVSLAVLFWLTTPFVEAVYYSNEQSRGAYPVNADSISIPIFQFLMGWLVFSPFVVLFVWWALRSYPGSVPFLAFNHQLKTLGVLSWLATTFLLSKSIMFGLKSVNTAHWMDVASVLLECYLAFCFNGVLQAKGRYVSTPDTACQMES